MSLQGYTLSLDNFSENRGQSFVDPTTASSLAKPFIYNTQIPTGSALRTFAAGSVSVTVIDPNGEGVCKPRLVATASLSVKIINSTSAEPGNPPFSSVEASDADINALSTFLAQALTSVEIPDAA